MDLTFIAVVPEEREAVAAWIAADSWPFHGDPAPTPDKVLKRWDDGAFLSEDSKAHWICLDGEKVGLVTLQDLTDDTPVFDLRIGSASRGRGIGRRTLEWMVQYVFETWPHRWRIEGFTRVDNVAMRRLFRQCGWAKEAHYRTAWPSAGGEKFDAIGYGITREDWLSGTVTPVDWHDEA